MHYAAQYSATGGEPTEKRCHFGRAHLSGVVLVVMENEVADPEPVVFFGARAKSRAG